MGELSQALQYGVAGLLLVVLVGIYLLARDFFKRQADLIDKQQAFVQKIAEDSIETQKAHTTSWQQMTGEVLKTINGFTVALGEVRDLITIEARERRKEHNELGLRKENL